jgi:hypothetical protein
MNRYSGRLLPIISPPLGGRGIRRRGLEDLNWIRSVRSLKVTACSGLKAGSPDSSLFLCHKYSYVHVDRVSRLEYLEKQCEYIDNLSSPMPYNNISKSWARKPDYDFPATFTVGSRPTEPFVEPAQLKGHLGLLNKFAALRTQVDQLGIDDNKLIQMPEDKDMRWTWFVGLAVER